MPKLQIEVTEQSLATTYASQILVGSAFAFINPETAKTGVLTGLNNFYGVPVEPARRRTLALLPGGQVFPGFTVRPATGPFKIAPVLLPDKEIYRAGQDSVRLLIVAPGWLFTASSPQPVARLVIENNGVIYRTQTVTLATGGLTMVEVGKLPGGSYRVYWDGDEAADYSGEKAECRFSSVDYVLSPLQATLLAHELRDLQLRCRLKVESYNEPLTEPVQIELWSGNLKLGQERAKPGTPGIYDAGFTVKPEATDRLEVRVSFRDQLATVVIPGSQKAERDETLLAGLGRQVRASLMPGEGMREVRGLFLNEVDTISNTPLALFDPAPSSGPAKLRWQVGAQAARLLVLDLSGKVVEERDLGEVTAGQEVEIAVPAPGGFLAVGAWLGEKAWEGWSALLAPSTARLEIQAPATARPGQTITLTLTTNDSASIYLRVRDTRLAGSEPQERLAAALKRGLEGANKWGTLGTVTAPLHTHPDWPRSYNRYPLVGSAPPPLPPAGRPVSQVMSPAPAAMRAAVPTGSVRKPLLAQEEIGLFKAADVQQSGREPKQAAASPRHDFADIAYCGILQTDTQGRASIAFTLPDAITSYSIEAFVLSSDGEQWRTSRESLEVAKPVWAEFRLPAFIFPGDKCLAELEVGSPGESFRLRLLCDTQPVPFTLSGARQTGPDIFVGQRAKALFEVRPGLWQAELEDISTQERDVTTRTVETLGKFKALARRFQLLPAGASISRRASGALQLRLLPSLDKPFTVLCDATAGYSHKCCEQTAAKLLAAVAGLLGGGDESKLREVILAGVAREKRMYLPGRGFLMYPPEESGGANTPNEYWGKLAAEHLSSLAFIGEPLFAAQSKPLDGAMTQALQDAMAMGRDAAQAYKLPLSPSRITSGRDAYRAVAGRSSSRNEAVQYARSSLRSLAVTAGQAPLGAVLSREEQAYCAATLLSGGEHSDSGLAVGAANQLASNLDSQGRLYSTVDSIALISLMVALRAAGIGAGSSRVRLDGRDMSLADALDVAGAGQVEEISVLEGTALIEITSEVVEDWNAFRAEVPVEVQGIRTGFWGNSLLKVGDNIELVIKIKRYEPGLLVHICLPPALSKIEGGGQVKKFSVDFSGHTEVRIPLRVTGSTLPTGEHWAILVRNMFNEEQAGNPGPQLVKVSQAGSRV